MWRQTKTCKRASADTICDITDSMRVRTEASHRDRDGFWSGVFNWMRGWQKRLIVNALLVRARSSMSTIEHDTTKAAYQQEQLSLSIVSHCSRHHSSLHCTIYHTSYILRIYFLSIVIIRSQYQSTYLSASSKLANMVWLFAP